jgi:hypothetical protein
VHSHSVRASGDAVSCECDYSYTCPACQVRIDTENQARYLDELVKWIVESLQALADKQGVTLESPPEKPGRY